MARHHLDRPIAVDNSYESFKARYVPGQSRAAEFDNTRCTAKVVSGYDPRDFIADPDMGSDWDGDDAQSNPLTVASGKR